MTFFFWVMKIIATTLGETFGDLLAQTWQLGYPLATAILVGFLIITLVAQMIAKNYHPALYWLVILSTSTAGTTISDMMNRTFDMGYMWGSITLASLLGLSLVAWYLWLGSLSVDRVTNLRTESMFWLAILVSNTLGTSLGDYMGDESGLVFASCVIVLGGLILACALFYYFTSMSRVLLFWAAFVLTRPLGATGGDLLTKSEEVNGLDLGTQNASIVLAVALAVCIGIEYWWRRRPAGAATVDDEDDDDMAPGVEPHAG
ncbi:MAG TPA: hypothetical protein VL860_08345 [Planctomycetota bacterium]|nr:hypothetical protein [Planctomycetota bacterium]